MPCLFRLNVRWYGLEVYRVRTIKDDSMAELRQVCALQAKMYSKTFVLK